MPYLQTEIYRTFRIARTDLSSHNDKRIFRKLSRLWRWKLDKKILMLQIVFSWNKFVNLTYYATKKWILVISFHCKCTIFVIIYCNCTTQRYDFKRIIHWFMKWWNCDTRWSSCNPFFTRMYSSGGTRLYLTNVFHTEPLVFTWDLRRSLEQVFICSRVCSFTGFPHMAQVGVITTGFRSNFIKFLFLFTWF